MVPSAMRSKVILLLVGALSWTLLASNAQASCQRSGAGLQCFDVTPSFGPAEPSAFRGFGEGKVLPASKLALGVHYQFAQLPLEMIAPSGDPNGRSIHVVDHSHQLELRSALGLGRGMDVLFAVPFGFARAGTGSEALSTQSPSPIQTEGVGDLRLGIRSRLPKLSEPFAWTMRFEATLPTGNERSYLGEGNATGTLASNIAWSLERFLIAADFGLTATKSHQFADVRLGTRLSSGLGVAYHILSEDRLTLGVEAWVASILIDSPTIVSQDEYRTRYHTTRVIPGEWHLNVSSRPLSLPIWFSLGAGTAFALSARDSAGAEASRVDERFIAPGTPRFRLTASSTVRF
jgi:hypothetical protein